MKKILNSTNNSYVEISQSKEDKKAGRKKIRMSAHTIYDSEMEYNKNVLERTLLYPLNERIELWTKTI